MACVLRPLFRSWCVFALLAATIDLVRAGTTVALDGGWRFHLGDVPKAERTAGDDNDWRTVDLPHDWSIEGIPRADAPSGGGGGFYPTGIGWYRRHFTADPAWRGGHVWIEFDGAYRDSEVWLNGHSLGRRPNGYASFRYELTPWLKVGADNVVTVRVDNSAQPNSRYYTGSGINRHVRLQIEGAEFVDPETVFISTTQLTGDVAEVQIEADVVCKASSPPRHVEVSIVDREGRVVGTSTAVEARANLANETGARTGAAAPGNSHSRTMRIRCGVHVSGVHPWAPESPALYTATLRLMSDSHELDRVDVPFGVRTVHVSSERGLELNGHPLKLFGCNLHDDNGPLGTAAFDRAEERRAELIKGAGFNAVRTAHNPPAPAFLSACDRLGLLVVEEAFDGWAKKKVAADYSRDFDAWSTRDLATMILRDRNHPSVVMWSVGNEPYERTSPAGAAIARRLSAEAHALDPSRPVTAAINGPGKNGEWSVLDPLFAALDVAGYNYEISHAESDHARMPHRVIMQTESYLVDAFASWSAVNDHPYIIGDFIWSGMDYLGEAGIGRVFPPDEPVRPHWIGSHFPWHGAVCGDLDLIGQRRPLSHYRAIVWNRGETLYAAVQVPTADGRSWNRSPWAPPPLCASWSWPGLEGRGLAVEVYSRHESARVYLNGRLLAEKPTTNAQQFKAVFEVPYVPGTLRVVGVDAGRETETFTLATSGAPAALRLHPDRTALSADGQDLAFIEVSLTDAARRAVVIATDPAPGDAESANAPTPIALNEWHAEPKADQPPIAVPAALNAPVTFTITGPAEIVAIGNSDLTSLESYQANPHRLHGGRALVVIRTRHDASGTVVLEATGPNLKSASVTLTTRFP